MTPGLAFRQLTATHWERLRRLRATPMPERIDTSIVLALTFMLWFCIPALIVLAAAG